MSNIDKHIDKQALREMAERAASDSWGYDRDEFNDAITPEVALALLDELEAAEKRIAELERKEQHSERQSVIDALAGSGEEWSDIEEYMQKWDAERASAAGKWE